MRTLTMDECESVTGGNGLWNWIKNAVGEIIKNVASAVLGEAVSDRLFGDEPNSPEGFDPGNVTEVVSPHPADGNGSAFRMNDGTWFIDIDGNGTMDARTQDVNGYRYIDWGDGNGWQFVGPTPQ